MTSDFQLYKAIHKATPEPKTVTFDVFDTLIFRPVAPELIIDASVRHLLHLIGVEASDSNMVSALDCRQGQWSKLFDDRTAKGLTSEDATIAELAPYWLAETGRRFNISQKNLPIASSLIDFEMKLERMMIQPIADSLESLKRLKEEGVKLFFISDMYMDHDQVASLLNAAGFGGLFEGGFVSGEVGLLKRTTSLFKHVKDAGLKIDLHVGDNKLADYDSPLDVGIEGLHWESPEMLRERSLAFKSKRVFEKEPTLRPYILNDLQSRLAQGGTTPLGLAFANFSLSLWKILSKKSGEILFPAREGLLFQELFARIRESFPVQRSTYIPLSRAVLVPGLYKSYPLRFVEVLLENNPQTSYFDLMRWLGFTDREARELLSECHISKIASPINSHLAKYALTRLFNHSKVNRKWQDLCESKRVEVSRLFADLKLSGTEFNLVDLGWNGTIQANLQALLPMNSKINGFYFGLNNIAADYQNDSNYYHSIVGARSVDYFAHLPFVSPQLLELCVLAPHSTVRQVPSTKELRDSSWVNIDSEDKSFSSTVQSEIINSAERLAWLDFVYPQQLESLSQFIRSMTAHGLLFPSKEFAAGIASMSTDDGLHGSNWYKIISENKHIRAGFAHSFWRQGWSALHLPLWLHTLLIARDGSRWGFEQVNFPDQSPDNIGGSNPATNGKSSIPVPREYKAWLGQTHWELPNSKPKFATLTHLRIAIALTNLNRVRTRRSRFRNYSIPFKALWANKQIFLNLFD